MVQQVVNVRVVERLRFRGRHLHHLRGGHGLRRGHPRLSLRHGHSRLTGSVPALWQPDRRRDCTRRAFPLPAADRRRAAAAGRVAQAGRNRAVPADWSMDCLPSVFSDDSFCPDQAGQRQQTKRFVMSADKFSIRPFSKICQPLPCFRPQGDARMTIRFALTRNGMNSLCFSSLAAKCPSDYGQSCYKQSYVRRTFGGTP